MEKKDYAILGNLEENDVIDIVETLEEAKKIAQTFVELSEKTVHIFKFKETIEV